jgi:hypothetical protein
VNRRRFHYLFNLSYQVFRDNFTEWTEWIHVSLRVWWIEFRPDGSDLAQGHLPLIKEVSNRAPKLDTWPFWTTSIFTRSGPAVNGPFATKRNSPSAFLRTQRPVGL